jgi:hypothetical protein
MAVLCLLLLMLSIAVSDSRFGTKEGATVRLQTQASTTRYPKKLYRGGKHKHAPLAVGFDPSLSCNARLAQLQMHAAYNPALRAGLFVKKGHHPITRSLVNDSNRNSSSWIYTPSYGTRHIAATWDFKDYQEFPDKFNSDVQYVTERLQHIQLPSNCSHSCAVVGSSGNLEGRGWGIEIEQHDFVFRIGAFDASGATRPFVHFYPCFAVVQVQLPPPAMRMM